MNKEKQRIAIAEACGFTDIRMEEWESVDIDSRSIAYGVELQGRLREEKKFIPDYLSDLNACHEMEKVLTDEQWKVYSLWLGPLTSQRVKEYIGATAAQRAEAFLKTLGKWEDGE